MLVVLGAALSGCGTPANSSAGWCDEHPLDNRC
jgi:hypothetical protein